MRGISRSHKSGLGDPPLVEARLPSVSGDREHLSRVPAVATVALSDIDMASS